jgi:hypothetical protein
MASRLGEQLEELATALMQAANETNKSTGLLWERVAEVTKGFGEELTRFRAWEALLYLFFARYYIEKPDPIRAATLDRDFLADQRRKFAQDEAGAQDIIKLYDAIFTYIKAGQEARQLKVEGEDEDTIM